MPDIIGIASPSRYSSFTSLETVVYFVCEDGLRAILSWNRAKNSDGLMLPVLADLVYQVNSAETYRYAH
jgi:alkyl hydroperoxide reductase subunit AhpC